VARRTCRGRTCPGPEASAGLMRCGRRLVVGPPCSGHGPPVGSRAAARNLPGLKCREREPSEGLMCRGRGSVGGFSGWAGACRWAHLLWPETGRGAEVPRPRTARRTHRRGQWPVGGSHAGPGTRRRAPTCPRLDPPDGSRALPRTAGRLTCTASISRKAHMPPPRTAGRLTRTASNRRTADLPPPRSAGRLTCPRLEPPDGSRAPPRTAGRLTCTASNRRTAHAPRLEPPDGSRAPPRPAGRLSARRSRG
jgi:hypothetical protein